MDSIAAAESGHLGLPLGAAEMGAVLYGQSMNYNPDEPKWINRDRFVLSAGHGSMFLYSWLHLAGFDLSKDEVANFRQHHSMTPGHPEFPNSEHVTPGIEATASRRPDPSCTNSGQIRSSTDRRVSAMSRRDQSSRRLRRMRVVG